MIGFNKCDFRYRAGGIMVFMVSLLCLSTIRGEAKGFSASAAFQELQEEDGISDRRIKGRVTDGESGDPVPGVNVLVKGTSLGTVTNPEGKYELTVPDGKKTVLVFSYLGYEAQQIAIGARDSVDVVLKAYFVSLFDKEVVVTGMFERDLDSFTGVASTFSGRELLEIGNGNVIESLKSLDPEFIVFENVRGSDPNALSKMEIRGRTSVPQEELEDVFGGDPNRPLFVMDGFETDLRTIVELDMNRVQSVTVLKDAASTALYGAKGANGVVVVVTEGPVAGEMSLSFVSNMHLSVPDLSSFNLMDSKEKLEFERLYGVYTGTSFDNSQINNDEWYNNRLEQVLRGVNTNWAALPLRNALTHSNWLSISGGNQEVRYLIGMNYSEKSGVMKGSARETWGTNMRLFYTRGAFHLNNTTMIDGSKGLESPYGPFSGWSAMNPYFLTRDEYGQIPARLGLDLASSQFAQENPLYNSLLTNNTRSDNLIISNNLSGTYRFSDSFRLQGNLRVSTNSGMATSFLPPENLMFEGLDRTRQGRYSETNTSGFRYNANFMTTYARVLAQSHRITANFRTEIQQDVRKHYKTEVVGFPSGTTGNPAHAFGYDPSETDKPVATHKVYRRHNMLGSVNYSYDRRYMMDAAWRLDGSTAFGSSRPYSDFWSFGLGWNVHNEQFFKSGFIQTLRIFGNTGTTGNESFGSTRTGSAYQNISGNNRFGPARIVQRLGNAQLEWQKTQQTSLNVNFVLWDNRIRANLNTYQNVTDPLIIMLALPASTGGGGPSCQYRRDGDPGVQCQFIAFHFT